MNTGHKAIMEIVQDCKNLHKLNLQIWAVNRKNDEEITYMQRLKLTKNYILIAELVPENLLKFRIGIF